MNHLRLSATNGRGLTKNQQNKNEDTSMNYFPITEYWRPLVPNAEIVYKITNPYFKNPCTPFVAENDADFVLVKKNASVYLC